MTRKRNVEGDGNLGQRVRDERKRQNLKQKDLADKAGLKASYLSRVEKGKLSPSRPALQVLAIALEVNPEWLERGEGDKGLSPIHGYTFTERNLIELWRMVPSQYHGLLLDAMATLVKNDLEDSSEDED